MISNQLLNAMSIIKLLIIYANFVFQYYKLAEFIKRTKIFVLFSTKILVINRKILVFLDNDVALFKLFKSLLPKI